MGISQIMDKRSYTAKKSTFNKCRKMVSECMFANQTGGGCSAEWCIFEELPKMTIETKKITCKVCGTAIKEVSIYSGYTDYICESCLKEIKFAMENTRKMADEIKVLKEKLNE